MKRLLFLLLVLPCLTYPQSRRVDTLFVKKNIISDSVAAPSPTGDSRGGLSFRGAAGLWYFGRNFATRIDSGYSGGGSGITSLNGLTASSQSFVNDSNVTITSSGGNHTIGFTGPLSTYRGGTGVTSLSNILGTSSQITVSSGTARVIGGNVTLSLPQNIDTSASFKAGGLRITDLAGELRFGVTGGNNIIITPLGTPSASKTYYLPEISGSTGTFMVGVQAPVNQYSTGVIGLTGLSGLGAATTVLGMNAAGTGLEYKTISAGTNIQITHSPAVVTVGITGTVAVANGGTGLSSLPSANRVLSVNTGGTAYVGKVLRGASPSGVTFSNDTMTVTADTSILATQYDISDVPHGTLDSLIANVVTLGVGDTVYVSNALVNTGWEGMGNWFGNLSGIGGISVHTYAGGYSVKSTGVGDNGKQVYVLITKR